MNLRNKLEGLPKIYYTNLNHRIDRKEYMESQFDYWKIKNYIRISSSKYHHTNENEWQDLVLDKDINLPSVVIANTVTQLEIIKNWLETTNEKYMILMEDDYDLSLIEFMNFNWNYLMKSIPQNWDAILLGFENEKVIPFFLHPVYYYNHGFGPILINRHYAEKLVKIHCIDNKFILNIKCNDCRIAKYYGILDHLMLEAGKVYAIPIITNNPNMGSDSDDKGNPRHWFQKCRDLYYDWWKNEHHKFSLEDFFTYGKSNDFKMIKFLDSSKSLVYE